MSKRSQDEAAALAAGLVCRKGFSRREAREAAYGRTGVHVPPERLEEEIHRWMRLFEPEALEERLVRRRRIALEVMQRLPALGLRLTGPVLSGTATAEDPAELVTGRSDAKSALLAALDAGFEPEALGEEGVFAVRLGGEPVVIRVLRPQNRSGAAAAAAIGAEELGRLLSAAARPAQPCGLAH